MLIEVWYKSKTLKFVRNGECQAPLRPADSETLIVKFKNLYFNYLPDDCMHANLQEPLH